MVEKNIQIKQHNGTDWDSLFPKTKAAVTLMSDGKTVETTIGSVLTSLAGKTTLSQVKSEVEKVVGSAPAALDTLKELADALEGDPNFASTITNSLSGKVDKVSGKSLSSNDFTTALQSKLNSLKDHTSEISGLQTSKADKKDVYSKTEVDVKISAAGIPVSQTAPTDSTLWFEEI